MASVVSERYALSLYEVAKERGKSADFFDELTAVAAVLADHPSYMKVLMTPSIEFAEKQQSLQKVFEGRVDPLMLNFLMLITEKARVALLPEMCEAYKELYYFDNGIAEVVAVTAQPLSDALTEKLNEKMCAVTGKQVVLKMQVDPSLLGGIVVKLENRQFDTSLKTKLAEIAQQLTKTIA